MTPEKLFKKIRDKVYQGRTLELESAGLMYRYKDMSGTFVEDMKRLGLAERRVRYLISIWEALIEGELTEELYAVLGWSRCKEIVARLPVGRRKDWFKKAAAEDLTVVQLEHMLRNGVGAKVRSIRLDLPERDADRFYALLAAHGATWRGNTLWGREEALMSLVSVMEAKQDEVA